MDTKNQDQKQAKTLPVTQLPIVTLTDKDMSSVNGGGYNSWAG
jgi:bacteriocin-like protein